MEPSKKQIELMRHALGLPNRLDVSYRNHYCIAEGDEGYSEWEELVNNGLAVKARQTDGWVEDFFYLTLAGAKAALLPKEKINPEDAKNMRRLKQRG